MDGRGLRALDDPDDPALRSEAFLGPPLLLALALQGVFCLHAASVAMGGRAVAVVGPSGAGKSTLARWLGEQPAWTRLTDDITPVVTDGDTARLEADFPQLKVDGSTPLSRGSFALHALVVLEPPGSAADEELECSALSPGDCAIRWVENLAGSRVFPSELLDRAVEAGCRLAERVPGFRVLYPRRRESLDRAGELLAGLASGGRP